MAEIIGVAASASQLATACFSLIDVVKKIKGGTSSLKRYHQQLQDLKSLSTCISENPLLQTPEVGVQTQAILCIINNNCLNSLLQKGRLLRTWGLLYREQDLVETFVKIERQKTNLSLAIEHIQSKALYQIQTDIQKMADKRGPSSLTSPSSTSLVSRSGKFRESQGPNQVPAAQYNLADLDPVAASLAYPIINLASQPQPDSNVEDDPPKPAQSDEPAPGPGTGPQYHNARAGPGVTQKNGTVYMMSTGYSQEIRSTGLPPSFHIRPVKLGPGHQINGHEFNRTDDLPGFQVPKNGWDKWIDPVMWPYPHATGPIGDQINGNVVRDFKQYQDGQG